MKNCKNCANRKGGTSFGKCIVTGYYITAQRKYPTGGCDENFSGWQPRPSIFTHIKKFFTGW